MATHQCWLKCFHRLTAENMDTIVWETEIGLYSLARHEDAVSKRLSEFSEGQCSERVLHEVTEPALTSGSCLAHGRHMAE